MICGIIALIHTYCPIQMNKKLVTAGEYTPGLTLWFHGWNLNLINHSFINLMYNRRMNVQKKPSSVSFLLGEMQRIAFRSPYAIVNR